MVAEFPRRVAETLGVLTLTLLAGASMSAASVSALREVNWRSTAYLNVTKASGFLYVSDTVHNVVDIYPSALHNPAPTGQITHGIDVPSGLAVDAAGNLYVANNADNTVTVYAPGGKRPIRTYSDGVQGPVQVEVDRDGTLYVGNFGTGSVTVYPRGSLSPSLTIVNQFTPSGLAVDAAKNLYVSYSGGAVYEYPPGSTSGTNLNLQIPNNPRGLAIDSGGDLLVANFGYPPIYSAIFVFPPGHTKPSQVIKNHVLVQPISLRFDRARHRLYEADFGDGHGNGGLNVFSYPEGKLLFRDVKGVAARAYGVGVYPAAL